jgi:predicted nucleic acid-binding protein
MYESVLQKLERLTGAPRTKFLQKWVRWVSKMIPPDVDPNVVVGEPKVTPDTVIKLFKEYCPDLEEGECYDKLVEVFLHSKVTKRSVFDPIFVKDFERKATISAIVSKILNLEWEVNPTVADSLYKAIFEERDVEKSCELVRYDVTLRWVSLGEDPPAEELKLAEKACEQIKELVARRAPPVEWYKVLEPVFRTREEILPSIKPYIARVKFLGINSDMNHLIKEANKEDLLILVGDSVIQRELKLRVFYKENLKPTDLIDKEALQEYLQEPVKIYTATQVREANELWYVNKFRRGKAEIPLICVYYQEADYIIACDRPAILLRYGEYVRVAPIPLGKQIKELYRKGIIVEEKEIR